MWFTRFILVLTLLAGTIAEEPQPKSDRSDYKRSLGKNCDSSYSTICLKLDIVSWLENINKKENLSVFPGVSIVRDVGSARANSVDIFTELAREFPNDPEARLDDFLFKKVQEFVGSHSIKVNLANENNAVTGRGKGGKKGGGGIGIILAAAAMMKGTLLALALGALAALAGKALMTGLISLLLSAIIGLKSLSGGGDKTTYEVITKPVYTHSSSHSSAHEDHHGGHGGYGRSFDVPLPLGLRPEYRPA